MSKAIIEANMPGVFYRRATPGDRPFKEPGDPVAVGDVIGVIEIMKSFTPVHASIAGRIVAFLVESEESVEPGQALCEVEV